MNTERNYRPGGKKRQINFLDKILGSVQKEGSGGSFIAIGKEESRILRSEERKTYGDSARLDKDGHSYNIKHFITKIEDELKKGSIDEDSRNISTEYLMFATQINISLQSLGIKDTTIQEIDGELRLTFDAQNQSKYTFFLQIFIKFAQDGSIVLDGLFKRIQPFNLSIRSYHKENSKEFQKVPNSLDSLYIMNANDELLIKTLYQNARITQKLIGLFTNLEMIMVNRKYFVTTFYDASKVVQILDLLKEIYGEFVNLKTGLKAVTYIKCFECGKDLDENDEQCPKCQAKRPRCAICLLDLQPSEKEEIVQIPCCGVYGHKNHIMMWIERAHTCPNCKTKQIEWLDELRSST
ncbi:MAG: hypothetical protein KGD64_15000 [Candidatus Heimdallarchaeota archaeon]|nr:hypothetical protein [Candidatus Heimdallarchaeota archaeon]